MARKNRVRRRRRRPGRGFASWATWKKALVIVGGIFVLLTTAGLAFAASKLDKIENTTLDASKLNISSEVETTGTGYLNVALFGLDTRAGNVEEGERSDTIIIASMNRETKEVKLCSVYRDTLMQLSDGSYNKANSGYAIGGPEEAVAMLNKNLDMDIQHYVTVDFNALVDVIDALGGVELDLTEEEVYWTNGYCTETSRVTGKITTELTTPGLQTLDGVQATSYCRIRYTTGDDFKRAERQRTVLEQIVKKAQRADISTINKIIDKVFPKVSTNFSLTEILAYAKDAFNYKLTEMNGFPFDKSTASLSGVGSSVIPETMESNVLQLHQFFFGTAASYSPSSMVSSISTEILNYSLNTISDEEAATYEPIEGTSGEVPDTTGTGGANDTSSTGGGTTTETPVGDGTGTANGSGNAESGATGSDVGGTGEVTNPGTGTE